MTAFFVTRAMDIARMKFCHIQNLQALEQSIGRCLFPFEIRIKFSYPGLKSTWGLSEIKSMFLDSAWESHAKRLAHEIQAAGYLNDNGGPIEPRGQIGEEWPVHVFDFKIFHAAEEHKIDFMYKKPIKKSRLLDEINTDEQGISGDLAVI